MLHKKRLLVTLLLLVCLLIEGMALAAAKPKLTLSLGATRVTVGFTTSVSYGMTDESTLPDDVTLASKDKKIATIDNATALVTGVKVGTTTLYAKSALLGKTANGSAKIQVMKNAKVWSKPATITVEDPDAPFILSTNKIYYRGDVVVAEVFVYNKTGRRTSRPSSRDIPMRIENMETKEVMSDYATGVYTDENTSKIAFKKSGVIRVEFPKSNMKNAPLFPKAAPGRLDMRSGVYEAQGSAIFSNGTRPKAGAPWLWANGIGYRPSFDVE